MAIFSFTAANVRITGVSGVNVIVLDGTAGADIDPGEFLYKDASDSDKIKVADNTSSEKSDVIGVAISYASDGNKVHYVANNAVIEDTGGITGFTVGELAVLSSTAGDIELITDLSSGDYVTHLGSVKTAGKLTINLNALKVQHP